MNIWIKKITENKIFCLLLTLNILLVVFFLFAPQFAPNSPIEIHADHALLDSSGQYPLGTDQLGRCFLSRLLYGGKSSLLMTIGIIVFISLAGTTVGIMAALAGGAAEQIFMRFLDVVLAIPSMVLVLVMVSIFGNGIVTTTIAIMSVSWITYARISHSLVLEFRESNFIKQAHMGGVRSIRILFKYVLPNVFPHIIVVATQDFGDKLLLLSSLSLLGLGAQPPTPEWGYMLSEGKQFMQRAPWLLFYPGFLIFIHVIMFNLLGDRLQDILDPKET